MKGLLIVASTCVHETSVVVDWDMYTHALCGGWGGGGGSLIGVRV